MSRNEEESAATVLGANIRMDRGNWSKRLLPLKFKLSPTWRLTPIAFLSESSTLHLVLCPKRHKKPSIIKGGYKGPYIHSKHPDFCLRQIRMPPQAPNSGHPTTLSSKTNRLLPAGGERDGSLLQDKINRRMRNVEREIHALKKRHNAVSYVSRLPAETLSKIFMTLAEAALTP